MVHFIPDQRFFIRSELAPTFHPLSGLQKRPAWTFPVGYTAKGTCVQNFKFLSLLEVDVGPIPRYTLILSFLSEINVRYTPDTPSGYATNCIRTESDLEPVANPDIIKKASRTFRSSSL
ncbi:hypothetical protein J6590_000590 [Homalodisca vitripennis]|nr:hypothetical protein J6590_000590 [Homalodisca vitripennis]